MKPGPLIVRDRNHKLIGTRFTIFSRHANQVFLQLYDSIDCPPSKEIQFNCKEHRVGDLWTIFVPDIGAGQLYSYRMEGPDSPEHRYHPELPLLDPYAKAVSTNMHPNQDQSLFRCEPQHRVRSLVHEDEFDWEGVPLPGNEILDLVIYEAHVKGMTAHQSSKVSKPGTYLGLIEKIPYLKELGINAIELLPIHEFDRYDSERTYPHTGLPQINYWGYNSHQFFTPSGYYAWSNQPGAAVNEFKQLVRELHRAEIEVILDVVYNHTGESDHDGPIVSFKGIDNCIYYHLEPDKEHYKNYTGCGNTVLCNHPVVQDLIIDSLKYWAYEMQVDGFRFDLAGIFSRDLNGTVRSHAPIVERLAEEPILRDRKLIAEAWDAAGVYQVGHFHPTQWSEWNGKYRDDVRMFWRGDVGKAGALATRIAGSSDLYSPSGRSPAASVNFITAHDGFTLMDLVSYQQKHNIENGEENRDGEQHNLSQNFGVEGSTNDPAIVRSRICTIKNMLATMLLSQGVPMLTAGDEMGKTQRGNNNAYCQDNEIAWIDWNCLEQNREIFHFCQSLIQIRKMFKNLRRRKFLKGESSETQIGADVEWFRFDGTRKMWDENDRRLMIFLNGQTSPEGQEDDLLLLINGATKEAEFRFPSVSMHSDTWRMLVDSSKKYPDHIGDLKGNKGAEIKNGTWFLIAQNSVQLWHGVRTETQ